MSVDLSSEPIADNDMQQFCVEMMKRLNIQRRNEHFCDVILEVGSVDDRARLKAHRIVLSAASPFFYNVLNSDMKEKKEGVIRLEETSKAVMEEVLEYLYTGHVDITEKNAFEFMAVADYFIIPCLKESSSKFISRTLCPLNCILAYYFAMRYQCPELQKEARDFIFANFMRVTESEDFLKLNKEQVEEWISSDEIRVTGEEDVFQVIVKWMAANEDRKHESFFQLFRHVRLVYLSRSYVFNIILPHVSLVKDTEICTAFVLDATKEISNGSEECYFAQPPRSCLKTHEDGLVACGQEKTFCYIPSENKWYEMGHMLSIKRLRHFMSACHGKLYASGDVRTIERYDPSENLWAPVKSYNGVIARKCPGLVNFQGFVFVIGGLDNELVATDSVHKYNPDTNLWQQVVPMSIARHDLCAVADGNSLYAMGGKSIHGLLDVVERYDPERNCWSRVASTLERKMLSCGAIVSGKVFLFGGVTSLRPAETSSLVEMYDPASNMWTGIRAMAAPRLAFDAVTFKGDVYVIGLWGQGSSPEYSYLKVYNVNKNEWKLCTDAPRGLPLVTLAPLRIPREILNTCKVVSYM